MDLNALVDNYREAIRGKRFDMANALHFYYDQAGLICRMINWHGQAA